MIGSHHIYKRSAIAAAVAATLASPTVVWAEAAGASSSAASGLEEIVVTARKEKEALQTTPVAVTALPEAALEQKQLVEVLDLARSVPNMSTGTNGPGPSSIVYLAIRGEAQNNGNSATDQAVGTYVDGVYMARAIVGNLGFLDVSNIEVLRGPQGTLFGRNTTGGALNVASNLPTDKFEGSVEAGTGNFSQTYAQGVLNVPLSDELAVRVAGRYLSHDGYFPDPVSGIAAGGIKHDDSGRISVRYAPKDIPLTIAIAADRTDERDTGTPEALLGLNTVYLNGLIPGVPLATLIPAVLGINLTKGISNSSNFFNTYNSLAGAPEASAPFGSNKAQGLSSNIDFDLGGLHVKSTTGFRNSISANAEDLDATPANFASFYSQYVQRQFSQELQLSGKIDKFDLIGGAYYFKESGTELSDSQTFQVANDVLNVVLHTIPPAFGGLPPGVFLPPSAVNEDFTDFAATSKAAYFQTNYHFTDTVRGTIGYRYTQDDRNIDRHGSNNVDSFPVFPSPSNPTPAQGRLCAVGVNAGSAFGPSCNDPHSASFSYPAYTVGLDWQVTPDTFLYAKTSRASIAGGFNTRPTPPGFDSFSPETNKDVELGVKNESFDHHLRTNFALFASQQTNLQNLVNGLVGTGAAQRTTQYVADSGNGRKYGAELEITAIPVENLELQLTGSYLHSAYESGSFTEKQVVPGIGAVTVDRSGEPMLQAPEYTFSAGITEKVPLSFGRMAFHLDYSYRASMYYNYSTPAPQSSAAVLAQYATSDALDKVAGYGLLNARITLQLDNPNIEFALWGRNLSNTQYLTYQFDFYNQLGQSLGYQGDPRTYGVTAKYKF